MSPMSDQPVTLAVLTTALEQFHREIVLPDIERVVERLTRPRFDQIDGHFDTIYHKLDKLETEYEALKAGLGRVEEDQKRMGQTLRVLERQYQDLLAGVHRLEDRLSRIEAQVDQVAADRDKEPLRAEVADLRARVDVLQLQVRNLENRVDREPD